MASIELIKKHRHYSGWVCFYKHQSEATKTEMKFSVFTPDLNEGERLKTLFWLSGLTCTEENFITKSNFGRSASEERMVLSLIHI